MAGLERFIRPAELLETLASHVLTTRHGLFLTALGLVCGTCLHGAASQNVVRKNLADAIGAMARAGHGDPIVLREQASRPDSTRPQQRDVMKIRSGLSPSLRRIGSIANRFGVVFVPDQLRTRRKTARC